MAHRLSIVVPGLCGPLPAADGLEAAAEPLLDLLGHLRRQKSPAADHSGQLAALFGLASDRKLADAAISLLAYGIDPGDGCWMHADPVNLLPDMDRAMLSDGQTLRISDAEAEQLVEAINTHFADDGLSVVMADACNWFVRLSDCRLETTPLRKAVGRNINHLLPTGDSAAHWRRVMNEAQMLLHISPVNQRREPEGLAPINSLWFWGEGVLPPTGQSDVSQVYADDALTTGLAKLHRIRHSALTDLAGFASAIKHDGHSLVSLTQLDGPCNYGDIAAWLAAMPAVVEDRLKPLIEVARSYDAHVDIYPCNGVRYHVGNNKFRISALIFRKKKPRLQDHVVTY